MKTHKTSSVANYINNRIKKKSLLESLPQSFDSKPDSWRSYDLDTMPAQERYRLLISAVIPRPVALITSINKNGIVNCAPFSYTSIICHDPPLVSSSINLSKGNKKDTLNNIELNEEWVHNTMSDWFIESANYTSGDFPSTTSELDEAGIPILPSDIVKVPRVGLSAVSLECKLYDKKEIYNDDGIHTTTLVIGKVVKIHIHEKVLKISTSSSSTSTTTTTQNDKDNDNDNDSSKKRKVEKITVDLEKFKAVGRVGDITYWPAGEANQRSIPRPTIK